MTTWHNTHVAIVLQSEDFSYIENQFLGEMLACLKNFDEICM